MSRSSTPPGTAERGATQIQIHYSPFKVLAASVLYAWCAGALVFLVFVAVFSGNLWLMITAGVTGVFVGPPLLSLLAPVLHPWTHRGPVVVLDAEGVTDLRRQGQNRSIAWANVGQVQLGAGNTSAYLAFAFRRPDREKQDGAMAGGLAVLFNRARLLSDWNISLRMLSCNRQAVLKEAQRLHQHNVRRHVVERNKDRSRGSHQGWSGTL